MNTALQKPPATAPATAKPSALNVMASRLSVEPAKLLDTLKATVFKNATNEELLALVTVANEYGLNPFLKEIYAFPAKGGGIVPVVSVDGWNKMLIRQPDFDGIEFEFTDREDGTVATCTATIYIKNRSKPVRITEYFDECNRPTEPWKNMPRRMLRNRTLCQAARLSFGFSGIYHEDEGASVIDISASPVPTEPPPRLVAAPPAEVKKTPQEELEALLVSEGFTFDQYRRWGADSGNLENADSIGCFADVPADVAARHLKAKKGLLAGVAQFKN